MRELIQRIYESYCKKKKTNVVDNKDTIYKFNFVILPLQIKRGNKIIIYEYVKANGPDYYFTYSSGIIAFDTPSDIWDGLFIREDKKYLKDNLMDYVIKQFKQK